MPTTVIEQAELKSAAVKEAEASLRRQEGLATQITARQQERDAALGKYTAASERLLEVTRSSPPGSVPSFQTGDNRTKPSMGKLDAAALSPGQREAFDKAETAFGVVLQEWGRWQAAEKALAKIQGGLKKEERRSKRAFAQASRMTARETRAAVERQKAEAAKAVAEARKAKADAPGYAARRAKALQERRELISAREALIAEKKAVGLRKQQERLLRKAERERAKDVKVHRHRRGGSPVRRHRRRKPRRRTSEAFVPIFGRR